MTDPGSSPLPTWSRFERRLFATLLLLLLLPSGLFLLMSYLQLNRVLADIHQRPESQAQKYFSQPAALFSAEVATIALEVDVIAHRHQRSTALLATRTWMRFMGLMFGAVLMMIGCTFILGRVSGPAYEGDVGWGNAKGSLKSTSPGLFLIAAGVLLMAIPNLSTQQIQTDDTATYFRSSGMTGSGPTGGVAAGQMTKEQLEAFKKAHGL